MHILADLIVRELAMLLVVAALGSAPTSWLGSRFDLATRLAIAPALGFCLATCVFTSLLWFFPADETAWLLPVVACASLAVAIVRERTRRVVAGRGRPATTEPADTTGPPGPSRPILRSAGAIAPLVIVCLVVMVPFTLTLHQQASVGPVAFHVYDADGYVAITDGAQHQSLRSAKQAVTHGTPEEAVSGDLPDLYWISYAAGYQQLDATPLSANMDELLGLGSTDTQSSFLIALILVGALGMFAAVRYAVQRPTWTAVLAGCLFGGAYFLQLFVDGSQGALAGLSVLFPLVLLGAETLRAPRPANLALFALVCSGLMAVYPLFVSPVACMAFVTLVAVGIRRLLSRPRPTLRWWAAVTARLLAVAGLAAVFDLVAFTRDLQYWRAILENGYKNQAFPVYPLGPVVVPGWLLQTRSLYDLSFSNHSVWSNALLALAVPLVVVAAILFGLRRSRVGLSVVVLIGACVAMGLFERLHDNCSYCEDRGLLPVGPALIFLLAVGMATFAASAVRWQELAAAGIAFVTVSSVGYTLEQERNTVSSAYFLGSAARLLVEHVPKGATVDLEGFNEGAQAPGEQVFTYEMVSEMTGGHVSLPADVSDNSALAYLLGTYPLHGPQFRPGYQYVLTRIPGVLTDRRTILRDGGVALEKRTDPLDVTLDYGTVVPMSVRLDPQGATWVNPADAEPVQFVVSGGTTAVPVYVQARFFLPPHAVTVSSPDPLRQVKGSDYIDVCVHASGSAPVRTADVSVTPGLGVDLASLAVTAGGCTDQP